mgnify:CR=1 FL=1
MSEDTNNNVDKTYTDPETGKFLPGNPGGGRPPGSGISITTEIKKKLAEVPEGQKSTYLQLLINRIMKQAIQDGDQQMITRIWQYIDGMPKQESTVNLGGEFNPDKLLDLLSDKKDESNSESSKNSERLIPLECS